MPTANYALASQRLNTGGDPGRLSPVLISGNAARGIRAPYININAANVRYTPMPIPRMVKDRTGEAATRFMNTLVGTAFDYKEREDKAQADVNVNYVNRKLQDLYYGYTDDSGKHVEGLSELEGEAAVKAQAGFQERINGIVKETLDNSSDNVRLKSVLRMDRLAGLYSESGARHKSVEFRRWQAITASNQETLAIQEIISRPTDAASVVNTIEAQLNEINQRYEGRPDAAFAARQEFVDKAILTSVNALTSLGASPQAKLANLDKAEVLIGQFGGMKGVNQLTIQVAQTTIADKRYRTQKLAMTESTKAFEQLKQTSTRRQMAYEKRIDQAINTGADSSGRTVEQILDEVIKDPTWIGGEVTYLQQYLGRAQNAAPSDPKALTAARNEARSSGFQEADADRLNELVSTLNPADRRTVLDIALASRNRNTSGALKKLEYDLMVIEAASEGVGLTEYNKDVYKGRTSATYNKIAPKLIQVLTQVTGDQKVLDVGDRYNALMYKHVKGMTPKVPGYDSEELGPIPRSITKFRTKLSKGSYETQAEAEEALDEVLAKIDDDKPSKNSIGFRAWLARRERLEARHSAFIKQRFGGLPTTERLLELIDIRVSK